MRLRLQRILFAIRSNFWFIPALLALAAVLVAVFIVELDSRLLRSSLGRFSPSDGMPIESVRVVLSTIAGSMITVAALVFSMTLVALTMVSQQFGPRLLLRFMDDRPTQFVLGLFLATFIYALIVLVRVGQWSSDYQVSGLAVLIAAALAVVSMGAVIHFIHHVATRIQADVLIAELGDELRNAARLAVEAEQAQAAFRDADERQSARHLFEGEGGRRIALDRSGYVNYFDTAAALATAHEAGLVVRFKVRRGEFVLAGAPVMTVVASSGCGSGAIELDDETIEALRGTVSAARRRTPEASMEFEINALVEVALRALSPGINDPHTAMTCIDWLADGMVVLMELQGGPNVVRDEDEVVRVIFDSGSFEHFMATAFHPIRHAASGKVEVLVRLGRVLGELYSVARGRDEKAVIQRHIDAVREESERLDISQIDAASVESAIGPATRSSRRS